MIDHICRNVVLSASAVLYKELYCFDHCTCLSIIIYKKNNNKIKKIKKYINIYTLIMAAINMCDQKSVYVISELIINGKT